MGLIDRLKAAVTPVLPPIDGEEFDVNDDPFYDVIEDNADRRDYDDTDADVKEGVAE